MTTQVPPNQIAGVGHNDPFAALKSIATDLGTQAGKGKDTRVKFFIAIVDAGYGGVIDLNANKHGPERDDSSVLMEAYTKAQGSATVFDTKAPNIRKEVACARTCVKLGQWPKGGTGEPVATMNNLLTIRNNLKKDPAQAKKLDDAANTLLKYARAQIRRDTLLDADELTELCYKRENNMKTALQYLQQQRDNLEKLYLGKAVNSTACDNDPMIEAAIKMLDKRIKVILTQQKANTPAPAAAVTPALPQVLPPVQAQAAA